MEGQEEISKYLFFLMKGRTCFARSRVEGQVWCPKCVLIVRVKKSPHRAGIFRNIDLYLFRECFAQAWAFTLSSSENM